MTKTMSSVLVVERDPGLRTILKLALRSVGFGVQAASDEAEAKQLLKEALPDVLILDLPNRAQAPSAVIDLYKRRRRTSPPVLILIATERLEDRWRARFQPDLVIYKPFDIRFLVRRTEALIQTIGLAEPAHS